MLEASSNLPYSLFGSSPWIYMMCNTHTGLRFYYVGETARASKFAIGIGHL